MFTKAYLHKKFAFIIELEYWPEACIAAMVGDMGVNSNLNISNHNNHISQANSTLNC